MADDNILRSFRSNDTARRPAGGARDEAGGSDPLAELARLIGQTDPFADLGRNSGPAAQQRSEPPPSDWRQTAAALARESMRGQPAAAPSDEPADSNTPTLHSYRTEPKHNFGQPVPQAAFADHNYADENFDDAPRFGDGHFAPHDGASGHDERQPNAAPNARAQQPGHAEEDYLFDDAAPPDDAMYDDPPNARGANGLVTAIVLIGCAIAGTAGAYGYRAYFSAPRSGDAPIISADTTPSKIVPASNSGDAQSGKSIQDRIGGVARNERIVPHQEDPVVLGDPNAPRVVLPAPFTPSPGPGPSVQPSSTSLTSAGTTTEPKKVHTVPIRPDGSEAAPRSVGVPPPAAQPLQLSPSAVTASVPRQPPPAPAKPAPQPARNSGAPLSLDPGGSASAYQSPPRENGATASPAPPQLASVPSAATGVYVVQVSSQRSETDAQASFRSLQTKFPRELGDRTAVVRRADLGPKGTYYRAMVGPFGSASDADQFCGSLKAAGGQCIVQRN